MCNGDGGLKHGCSTCGGSGWLQTPAKARKPNPGETSVGALADELKKPIWLMLEQFKQAGASKIDATDAVTDADKRLLLEHLVKRN
jgi:hypothetical protein